MYRLHKAATALRQARSNVRHFHGAVIASQDKRPLQEAQLKESAAKAPPPTPPPPAATPPSGGSNNALLGGIAALAVAGGGAYYYYSTTQQQPVAISKDVPITKDEEKQPKKADDNGQPHRVTQIDISAKMKNTTTAATAVPNSTKHPVDGHRVLMTPETVEGDDASLSEAAAQNETERALQALQSSVTEAATEALLASHPTMWTATSTMAAAPPGTDLDDLSEGQLKSRIVQLATELRDRTKWEALRLKEFLAMKEQEVSNEYTKLMQKQRMEFEDLLAQRLRQQEHALQTQLDSAMLEKDANIQSLLNAALSSQKQEFQEEKVVFEKMTEAKLKEALEAKYAAQMEELKTQTAQDLQAKVDALQELSAKVAELQQALSQSQSHQAGSAQAHRLSAAALNLSERLVTHQPAGDEIAALSAIVGSDGGVIATAVATIPPAVYTDGVPTLAQLQTWFDDIYDKVRQAALVPAGRPGLEGQLAGRVLASLKFAPVAKDEEEDDDKDDDEAEKLLAKARRSVQKGDLTAAVALLERLPVGQARLTLADWKAATLNRILVDKAVKVIKMECALLNESMAT